MAKKEERVFARIRDDLSARLLAKQDKLMQSPNSMVNLMVEGCLDAMEKEPDYYRIPVVELYRRAVGKYNTSLFSRVMTSVADLSSDLYFKTTPTAPTMKLWREKCFEIAVIKASEHVEKEESLSEKDLIKLTREASDEAADLLGIERKKRGSSQ